MYICADVPVTRYQSVDDPAIAIAPGASISAPSDDGSSTVGICAALTAACAATTSAIGPNGRHAHTDAAPPPPPGAAGAVSSRRAAGLITTFPFALDRGDELRVALHVDPAPATAWHASSHVGLVQLHVARVRSDSNKRRQHRNHQAGGACRHPFARRHDFVR